MPKKLTYAQYWATISGGRNCSAVLYHRDDRQWLLRHGLADARLELAAWVAYCERALEIRDVPADYRTAAVDDLMASLEVLR